jgi:hypothetical protein
VGLVCEAVRQHAGSTPGRLASLTLIPRGRSSRAAHLVNAHTLETLTHRVTRAYEKGSMFWIAERKDAPDEEIVALRGRFGTLVQAQRACEADLYQMASDGA